MSYSIAQTVKNNIWDSSIVRPSPWIFNLPRCVPSARREEERAPSRFFVPAQADVDETCIVSSVQVSSPRAIEDTLPLALSSLRNAVKASCWMLDLAADWDEEGAIAYDEATWKRAVRFLCESAVVLWGETGIVVPAPEIQNGPEGTIDLFWESDEVTLLINIPVNPAEPATYYGSNKRGEDTRGTVFTDRPNKSLLLWARG